MFQLQIFLLLNISRDCLEFALKKLKVLNQWVQSIEVGGVSWVSHISHEIEIKLLAFPIGLLPAKLNVIASFRLYFLGGTPCLLGWCQDLILSASNSKFLSGFEIDGFGTEASDLIVDLEGGGPLWENIKAVPRVIFQHYLKALSTCKQDCEQTCLHFYQYVL